MAFRQIHTSKDSYKYSFFPLAIVQWNALLENVATSPWLIQGSSLWIAASQALDVYKAKKRNMCVSGFITRKNRVDRSDLIFSSPEPKAHKVSL